MIHFYAHHSKIGFVVGEMKNPSLNLPRVLNSAMGLVISLSVLVNVAFYEALPLDVMQSTNAVALVSILVLESNTINPFEPLGFWYGNPGKDRSDHLLLLCLYFMSWGLACDSLFDGTSDPGCGFTTLPSYLPQGRYEYE